MDVLSDVLATVRLQSEIHFCPEPVAPWGIQIPAQPDRAVFYLLSRGSCYMQIEGNGSHVPLVGGDVVMLPQGVGHTLRDQPSSSVIPIEELLEGKHSGNSCESVNSTKSSLVSGYFRYESQTAKHFLSPLPELIHIQSQMGHQVPLLDETLKFLAAESNSTAPGAETILARLTDVLFVQILRAFIAMKDKSENECAKKVGMLHALVDPQIGKALSHIHERFEFPWTVATLAEQVAMSRTGFAVRFTGVVGIPPLDYVRKWRMQKAAEMLREENLTMDQIAIRVGYESSAAFSKTFKREIGISPGAYRTANGKSGFNG